MTLHSLIIRITVSYPIGFKFYLLSSSLWFHPPCLVFCLRAPPLIGFTYLSVFHQPRCVSVHVTLPCPLSSVRSSVMLHLFILLFRSLCLLVFQSSYVGFGSHLLLDCICWILPAYHGAPFFFYESDLVSYSCLPFVPSICIPPHNSEPNSES